MNVRICLITDAIVSIVDTRLRLTTETLMTGETLLKGQKPP